MTEPYYPPFEDIKREMLKDIRKATMGFLKMLAGTATVLGILAFHIWFFTNYLGLGEDAGVPLGVGTAICFWLAIPGGWLMWYGSVVERLRDEKTVKILREGRVVERGV